MKWKIRNRVHDLSSRGMIMGILNVTPDSFSDGGKHPTEEKAVARALEMTNQGAQIIDIGGESTRPGALDVSLETELERTIGVIESIRSRSDVLISIDTSKAEVARQAIRAGADIVNDVTGLEGDPDMQEVCRRADIAIVAMHMQGTPATMQQAPAYSCVIEEVREYFTRRLASFKQAGIDPLCVCFDPGIGFGKTPEHNKTLMKHLPKLRVADRPLLLGVSRKSMIGLILERENPAERDWGTVALTAHGRMNGAEIHRVHEVKKNLESMRMIEAIMAS